MPQHLFLLCGLPFSGKSTMGRTLERRLGVVHVEVDRLHVIGNIPPEGRQIEREEWIAAYQAAYLLVEGVLASGRSAVFDAVSYRRLQRQRIKRIADKLGVPMTIVYLDVSPEEARARLEVNRDDPKRVNVPSAAFAEVAAGMQPPDPDEPTVVYHPSEPLPEWIDRVIAPLVKETRP